MEHYIHKYLSKFFILSTNEESGKKLQILVFDGIYYQGDTSRELVYCTPLIKEISTVFAVTPLIAKELITVWATSFKFDVDLTWYWEQEPQLSFTFPAAVRIAAQTIASELIAVKPMSMPTGTLFYLEKPDSNAKVMTDEEIVVARRNYLAREEQTRESWGNRLYSDKINELLENQNQMIGVSSRKKED